MSCWDLSHSLLESYSVQAQCMTPARGFLVLNVFQWQMERWQYGIDLDYESKDLSFGPSSVYSTVLSCLSHRNNGLCLIYLMCWKGVVWIKQGPKRAGKEYWRKEIWDGLTEVNSHFLSDLCSCSASISKLNVDVRLKTPAESDIDARAS